MPANITCHRQQKPLEQYRDHDGNVSGHRSIGRQWPRRANRSGSGLCPNPHVQGVPTAHEGRDGVDQVGLRRADSHSHSATARRGLQFPVESILDQGGDSSLLEASS